MGGWGSGQAIAGHGIVRTTLKAMHDVNIVQHYTKFRYIVSMISSNFLFALFFFFFFLVVCFLLLLLLFSWL